MLDFNRPQDESRIDPLVGVTNLLLDNPRIDAAILCYCENILQWRQGSRLLNKVVGSYARSAIIGYLLYLHYAADKNDPDAGATFLKLLRLCEQHELCSSRVLTTVVALLRVAGYVSVSRGITDRRVRPLRPTSKLLDQVHAWYGHVFGVLDILHPEARMALRHNVDPDFFGGFIISISRPYFEQRLQIGEYYPAIFQILRRDSGFPTLAAILETRLKGRPAPTVASIATRFHATNSQIRYVVKAAAENGLLTLGANGRIVDSDALAEQLRAFIARELGFYLKYASGLDLAL